MNRIVSMLCAVSIAACSACGNDKSSAPENTPNQEPRKASIKMALVLGKNAVASVSVPEKGKCSVEDTGGQNLNAGNAFDCEGAATILFQGLTVNTEYNPVLTFEPDSGTTQVASASFKTRECLRVWYDNFSQRTDSDFLWDYRVNFSTCERFDFLNLGVPAGPWRSQFPGYNVTDKQPDGYLSFSAAASPGATLRHKLYGVIRYGNLEIRETGEWAEHSFPVMASGTELEVEVASSVVNGNTWDLSLNVRAVAVYDTISVECQAWNVFSNTVVSGASRLIRNVSSTTVQFTGLRYDNSYWKCWANGFGPSLSFPLGTSQVIGFWAPGFSNPYLH